MFGTCKKVKAVSFDGCTLFLSSYKLNCWQYKINTCLWSS
jgi:hypothetical protein